MPVKTTLAQLEEVQAAITAVMGGQSYMLDGLQVTRASLNTLTMREDLLLKRYQKESGTRPRIAAADLRCQ
jgi:hypothetical protein